MWSQIQCTMIWNSWIFFKCCPRGHSRDPLGGQAWSSKRQCPHYDNQLLHAIAICKDFLHCYLGTLAAKWQCSGQVSNSKITEIILGSKIKFCVPNSIHFLFSNISCLETPLSWVSCVSNFNVLYGLHHNQILITKLHCTLVDLSTTPAFLISCQPF